jgi:eukaryotic-like serine/threonine-protein kinase
MGEVYRATDINLGRQVAIKVLPDAFASDAERLARFDREAKTLAALNHPNIATIYGLERSDGMTALVMELVEGPTLADRIALGKIPGDEALAIAKQIAEALDAAHERGIVHRDLKPANVKITPERTVKLLDFGLAKSASDSSAVSLSHSPTVTVAGTLEGVILGTAAYMSPEQARGKSVDKRTDIWAFGCVLYEMLTGVAAFGGGETVSDIIGRILEREPDWTRLPQSTPLDVRALLRRCLDKDLKRRLRDMGDARAELEERVGHDVVDGQRPAGRILVAAALGVGIVLGAVGAWSILRARAVAPLVMPTNFTFTAADEAAQIEGAPVVSPDGRRIAFAAVNGSGERALWIRSLDSSTPRRIDGTDGANRPFWSPDGQSVAFGVPAQGRLKRVDLSSGFVQNIGPINDAFPGGAWGRAGTIVFSPDNRVVLQRVSASGGTAEPATVLDPAKRENSHRFPHFLPDGQHFLFTARSDVRENTGIYLGRLGSTERTWLVEAQSSASYAAPGYILFVREGTLLAQPFDLAALRMSGEPFVVATNVAQATAGAEASFSVSDDGRVVAFRIASPESADLVWFDRGGERIGNTIAEGPFQQVRLAPDGKRAAVTMNDRDTGNRDIWQIDLTTGATTRFTSHPANDWHPVWSRDGTELAFDSDRAGLSSIFRRPADGSKPEVEVPTAGLRGHRFVDDWSPDGRMMAVRTSTQETTLDAWIVPLDDRKPYEIARTTFQEHSQRFSPDGRWLAFVSSESGALEVYVHALGKVGKHRVSTSGGTGPRWRGDSRELFFVDGMGRLASVSVAPGDAFVATPPVVLFNACGTNTTENERYEIYASGQRSLWICPSRRDAAARVSVSVRAPIGSKVGN